MEFNFQNARYHEEPENANINISENSIMIIFLTDNKTDDINKNGTSFLVIPLVLFKASTNPEIPIIAAITVEKNSSKYTKSLKILKLEKIDITPEKNIIIPTTNEVALGSIHNDKRIILTTRLILPSISV
ncbi:MAG: hypothetical protein FWG36_04565 [Oscillospiraceae bacterium]|nr:hypothetical protein [Oscillospiraceae bacterium]